MHLQRACGSAVVLVVALLVPPCSGDAPATAPAPPLGRPLRKADFVAPQLRLDISTEADSSRGFRNRRGRRSARVRG
jgi:hypothetical protein